MPFFIPSAHAQATGSSGGELSGLLLIAGMFILMYFMIIRPQRKRQKEHKLLVDELSKGDEVLTTGGILGKVTKVDGDYMVLEVSNNIELTFQKIALHAVLPKGTIKAI
ncbi:preprotein translocase subunit YajC [Candidatus Endobugula sertula]|uniref:Sec translocon accessory complex subunit YajC n=1 Tax=Candidatus Endobugula sertula TaxID=62101 RepID=A0A1D2QSF2_9GAMM|nr:preprotein translocase subunit YajC [Candidatus Endobugula sertula]